MNDLVIAWCIESHDFLAALFLFLLGDFLRRDLVRVRAGSWTLKSGSSYAWHEMSAFFSVTFVHEIHSETICSCVPLFLFFWFVCLKLFLLFSVLPHACLTAP